MDRIFEPRKFITVPDGTQVSAFLNATDDSQTDVPWGILGDMSIAAGQIEPGVSSWIHRHPAVTVVTYLVSGNLRVWMKEARSPKPYKKDLTAGQAVLVELGILFQLQNISETLAEVLYIASPTFVFEMQGDDILYDDALLVARNWEELESDGFDHPNLRITTEEQLTRRSESLRRLAERKS